MGVWKITKMVFLAEDDVASDMAMEDALSKAIRLISDSVDGERIVFVIPVPRIIRDWLFSGHYRLARLKYCAMASGLGVPSFLLMDIFRLLNGAIEWTKRSGSLSDSQKQEIFLRFGERLSAELFALSLARRLGDVVVSVVDDNDIVGSHFVVGF